ncbi:MAG: AAA family ATPase [Gemmatimonadales bacterium]
MRLHRVKLVNFRQHADTEIVLGPGITAVVGPNGAGKSTLLEAIAWAFYGNQAARGSRDTIRRINAPARSKVQVEVDFALGSHEFHVVRGVYNAELFQDGQREAIANSQQEVTRGITRVLGMTHDEFFNTYFTGQKELAVMANLGPADRARFLSRILGYDKLKLAQDRLRKTRSGLKGELTGLEQGLGDKEALLAELQGAKERTREIEQRVETATASLQRAKEVLEVEGPEWSRMVSVRESVLSLESEMRVAERDVEEARREFERLDKELAEALAARSQLETIGPELARIRPLSEELDRLDNEAQASGRKRALSGQLREVEKQGRSLSQRAAEIDDAPKQLEIARQELEDLRKLLRQAEGDVEKANTAWIRDKQDAETKRQSLRDRYRDLQDQRERIVAAGSEGECPTCARPLGPEYGSVLKALERQLEEIEIDGRYFAQRVEQLSKEPSELADKREILAQSNRDYERGVERVTNCESRVREREQVASQLRELEDRKAQLEQEIKDLPEVYDADRHEAVRDELRSLEPVKTRGVELRVKAEAAETLVQRAEAAESVVSEAETRFDQLRKALEDLGYSDDLFARARESYEQAESAVREAELQLVAVEGDRKAARAAVELAERRVREREERAARVDNIKADLHLHDELDAALGDLRVELNATMRPEIAERASVFFSDLTDGRYDELELDDHYRVLVVENGLPKSVISGGEEDLVNLVLRLAISQMVAERAGQPLSLLVLDEVFGSLDEDRRHHVVELLRRLTGRFPQVVLITHIESIKEGVDRVLRVEFDQDRGAAAVTESREASTW